MKTLLSNELTSSFMERTKSKFYKRILENRAKPYRGMKYFPKYNVWAINLKNAIRKSN